MPRSMNLTHYIFLLLLTISNNIKAEICFSSFERDTSTCKEIFIGKVVDVAHNKVLHYGQPKTIFTFEVSRSFKGFSKYLSYISVVGPFGGCCVHNFIKDSTYLVFAYGDGVPYTNDCSSSGLLSERGIYVSRLGSSIVPDKKKWQFEILQSEQRLLDSIRTENRHLQNELQSIILKNRNQEHIQAGFIITILLILTSLIIAFRRKKVTR